MDCVKVHPDVDTGGGARILKRSINVQYLQALSEHDGDLNEPSSRLTIYPSCHKATQ